jgi:hypothetical protein
VAAFRLVPPEPPCKRLVPSVALFGLRTALVMEAPESRALNLVKTGAGSSRICPNLMLTGPSRGGSVGKRDRKKHSRTLTNSISKVYRAPAGGIDYRGTKEYIHDSRCSAVCKDIKRDALVELQQFNTGWQLRWGSPGFPLAHRKNLWATLGH